MTYTSSKRIHGEITMQSASLRPIDDMRFDCTDQILLMSLEEIKALSDDSESTDEVARAHVQWGGPSYTTGVCDSTAEFFGVNSLSEITQAALDSARQAHCPQAPKDHTLNLTFSVQISVQPGQSISEFIENLDYQITSKTPGVIISNTEMIDA